MARAKRRKRAAPKKTAKRRRRVRRVKRAARGRPRAARTVIKDAVSSVEAYRRELTARRDDLDHQIRQLDSALAAMSAGGKKTARKTAAPARRRRGRRPAGGGFREGSLKAFIQKVLSGSGTMSVKDITARVVKSGYQSKNKTLAKSVGIALTEMPSVKRMGRGRFRLR